MKVKEVLETAREAAIKKRQLEEQAEIRRQSIGVQGHNSFEVHAKSGILDPMRHVVELMDWQDELVCEEDLDAPIMEAYEIVAGIERISRGVIVETTMRYYLQGESWRDIVDGYERSGIRMTPIYEREEHLKGLSKSKQTEWLQAELDKSMEKWEKIGIAHLKEKGRQD